jgi:CopC domain
VEAPVDFVVLEFLDPVVPTPVVTVSGPDGQAVPGLAEARLIADDVVRVAFDPLTEAGAYQVDYSFVASDGATQEGAHRFTFEPDDGFELDTRRLLAWIVGALLVALLVVAVLGRRRSRA